MSAAPIIVHRPLPSGGRRVTVHLGGRDEILDLTVFLEAAGILAPERAIDDPAWVEWRGGRAHEWDAA
ncbi:hypothetical protein [Streptomyces sp. NPDC047974]|uniref:hypothetical protein n=1 Tax=Streptomyces sp. NPDC047974 TaxID=3154343 RepID=UPI0033C48E04